MDRLQGLAKSAVQSVDRPVALAHGVHDQIADFHFDSGFGPRLIASLGFDIDAVGEPFELGLIDAGRLLHQQVEGGFCCFEFIAFVLQLLHAIEDFAHERLILDDLGVAGVGQDRGLAGQLADQDTAFVADRRRVDVLVAGGVAGDTVGVHASLVRESARADERLSGAKIHVGRFINVS